jgi:hypothetical protein
MIPRRRWYFRGRLTQMSAGLSLPQFHEASIKMGGARLRSPVETAPGLPVGGAGV